MNRGVWYALGAYGLWGLLPIYWKWLSAVPALQLVCHRIAWSFIVLMLLIGLSGRARPLLQRILHLRVMIYYSVAVIFAYNFEHGDYHRVWDSWRDQDGAVLKLIGDAQTDLIVGHKTFQVTATLGQIY